MPLYEYICRTCGRESEVLIRGSETPHCEHCQSPHVERLMSTTRGHTSRAVAACRNVAPGCESAPCCGSRGCPMRG
ncbi:MAG: FmdB family zinc ribbon protein [Thermoguttaceae bacterium]